MPFFNTVDSCRWATHVLAVEGATFVLLASHTQSEKGLQANGLVPDIVQGIETPHVCVTGGGFSEIIAPDGRSLTTPVDPSWEGLIYGELDFNEIYLAKNVVDTVGQYSRPDIFSLRVNGNVNRQCVYEEVKEEFTHTDRFTTLLLDEE
jgi:cyanide hydratase